MPPVVHDALKRVMESINRNELSLLLLSVSLLLCLFMCCDKVLAATNPADPALMMATFIDRALGPVRTQQSAPFIVMCQTDANDPCQVVEYRCKVV